MDDEFVPECAARIGIVNLQRGSVEYPQNWLPAPGPFFTAAIPFHFHTLRNTFVHRVGLPKGAVDSYRFDFGSPCNQDSAINTDTMLFNASIEKLDYENVIHDNQKARTASELSKALQARREKCRPDHRR